MAKLTEAQRRALTRMADGDEVWTISGRNPHAFWLRGAGKNPSLATLYALEKTGLVENYKRDFTGGQYRITPAGRSALQEQGK